MAAWLSRAGAAPLALRPVLPGCAYGPRARKCDGTAPATQEGERAALKARGRNKISYIYRCNSRIGGGRWGRLGGGRERGGNLLVSCEGWLVGLPRRGPRKARAARQPVTGVKRHAGDARHPQARRAAPQTRRAGPSGGRSP